MKVLVFVLALMGAQAACVRADAQGMLGKIKDKAKKMTEKKEEKKEDDTKKNDGKKDDAGTSNSSASSEAASDEPPLKVYQNYDFVPGEKIIFEDNFVDDQDGEFPAHWKLEQGQAVVNKVSGKPALLLTEGNYASVKPRVKTDDYLGGAFTLEFDFIFRTKDGSSGYEPGIDFYFMKDGSEQTIRTKFGTSEVGIGDFSKTYPDELKKDFLDHWHHAAVILKDGQMKAYVDQYRVCVDPNIDEKFRRFVIDGIGDENLPIIVSNVKVAEGGGMNVIGQKFTEGKIITHGITFDVNKSNIKPESMGTLNGIVKLLKDNPSVKFEIGGYTDSDGDDAANMTLSQSRADAVMKQLVTMGIDQGRLTAKGYGETHPIADNGTPEGKALNRRVEFVKK